MTRVHKSVCEMRGGGEWWTKIERDENIIIQKVENW
jgi:hypothetical protein